MKSYSAILTLLASSLLLPGCAFHSAPFPMYAGSPSLDQTAVFSALDERTANFSDSRIRAVDTKSTDCAQAGCPYWVRVLPGPHKFEIRYTAQFQWNLKASGYKFADVTVEVAEMKPRHVYVARYTESNGTVKINVDDLGENPDYGISLGLEGANKKLYKVEFK